MTGDTVAVTQQWPLMSQTKRTLGEKKGRRLAGSLDEAPHHVRPDDRHAKFRPLLFGKIHYALAELLEYAAIMSKRFHRTHSYHPV